MTCYSSIHSEYNNNKNNMNNNTSNSNMNNMNSDHTSSSTNNDINNNNTNSSTNKHDMNNMNNNTDDIIEHAQLFMTRMIEYYGGGGVKNSSRVQHNQQQEEEQQEEQQEEEQQDQHQDHIVVPIQQVLIEYYNHTHQYKRARFLFKQIPSSFRSIKLYSIMLNVFKQLNDIQSAVNMMNQVILVIQSMNNINHHDIDHDIGTSNSGTSNKYYGMIMNYESLVIDYLKMFVECGDSITALNEWDRMKNYMNNDNNNNGNKYGSGTSNKYTTSNKYGTSTSNNNRYNGVITTSPIIQYYVNHLIKLREFPSSKHPHKYLDE